MSGDLEARVVQAAREAVAYGLARNGVRYEEWRRDGRA